MSSIAVKANDLSFGGFEGTLSTIVSSGVAIRTEDNSCRLISGDSLNPDGAGAKTDQLLLVSLVITQTMEMVVVIFMKLTRMVILHQNHLKS